MQTKPDFDVIIVGGGVVGLSIGYFCASQGYSTGVVERHERFCEEASTHNSGVVHSGFNPEPGTLKALLNIAGAELMYQKSDEWKFGLRKVGTLVAARNERQAEKLESLKRSGELNGLKGLEILDANGVNAIEPAVEGVHAALYSPEGGVIDIMEYIARLSAHASMEGAVLAAGREVTGISVSDETASISLSTGERFTSRYVVNSAGLHSDDVASMLGSTYTVYPCVGEYAFVTGPHSSLVRGMVYPVVEEGFPGLGIHLTRTYDGQLQVGPTSVYGAGKDQVKWRRTPLTAFVEAVRTFLPAVDADEVHEGWHGVRVKTVGPGSGRSFGDFVVEWDLHGLPAIHLVGIESPGLTSSLALGRHVACMIRKKDGDKC